MTAASNSTGEVYGQVRAPEKYGLREGALGPVETLAQSVSAMAPSTSSSLTIPLASGCTAKKAITGTSGAWTGAGSKPALDPTCFTIPLLPAGGLNGAIPTSDPYETGFTSGQRNIFRQAFQKRADASLVKDTEIGERYSLKYTFDVYNLSNTSSFDIPGANVYINADYHPFPTAGTPVLPGTCNAAGVGTVANSFYSCPSGLGIVTHTIGAPRQIQMSLHLDF